MKYVVILQIKDIEKTSYAFRSYKEASDKVDAADYQVVYRGYRPSTMSDIEICDDLFEEFNLSEADYRERVHFTGHSVSMSDIIRVDDVDESNPRFYYCDTFGWKLVKNFNNIDSI